VPIGPQRLSQGWADRLDRARFHHKNSTQQCV